MASRRARIKVAPNLGAGRIKNKPESTGPSTPDQKSATSAAAAAIRSSSGGERRPVTPTTTASTRLNINNNHHHHNHHSPEDQKPPMVSAGSLSTSAEAADVRSQPSPVSPLPIATAPVNDTAAVENKPSALSPPTLPAPQPSPTTAVLVVEGKTNAALIIEDKTNSLPADAAVIIDAQESCPAAPAVVTSPNVVGVDNGGGGGGGVNSGGGPPIRRHFGLKAKFKPNVAAAAAERHRHLVGDLPPSSRSRKVSLSESSRSPHPPPSSPQSEQQRAAVVASVSPPHQNRPRLRSSGGSEDEDMPPATPVPRVLSPSGEVTGRPLRLPPAVQRTSVSCSSATGGLPSTPLLDGNDNNSGEKAVPAVEKIAEIGSNDGGGGGGAILIPIAKRSRHLTGSSTAPNSPVAASQRHRRVSSSGGGVGCVNAALIRRKAEHRRRFKGGVPERRAMTMFDLIYYNPENGARMACTAEEEEQVAEGTVAAAPPTDAAMKQAAEEEAVDNPVEAGEEVPERPTTPAAAGGEFEEDEDGDSMPVPQVKVGANGEIILDEASTLVESTATKRARADMSNSPAVVETSNRATNYGTWSKRRAHADWSRTDTLRFFRALAVTGTDFSMMASLFKKRTRHELKLKFKREERANAALVDKCLLGQGGGQYTDLQDFPLEESEEEEEKVADGEKAAAAAKRGRRTSRKRKAADGRTRRRGSYVNPGYYDSSSEGEQGDVSETSRSPARKKAKPNQSEAAPLNTRRRRVPSSTTSSSPRPQQQPSPGPRTVDQIEVTPTAAAVLTGATLATPPPHPATTVTTPLQRLPGGVQFPPALLAANPGLLGAQPGSLVVVASPSKTDPSAQLLHVYMVKNRRPPLGPSPLASPSSPLPPQIGSPSPADAERTRIDPAVVRAVDRNRQSLERQQQQDKLVASGMMRARTYSEGALYRRQRTMSEGGSSSGIFNPGRIRTLSGSTQELAATLVADSHGLTRGPIVNIITTAVNSSPPPPPPVLGNSITTTTTTAVNSSPPPPPPVLGNSITTTTTAAVNSLPIAIKSKAV